MLGTKEDIFDKYELSIVDFGFATPFVDKNGNDHIEKTNVNAFRGNLVFSSLHQLKFKTTSRRDDMISLFYLLVYLLKNG